jgi:hypothetical protein
MALVLPLLDYANGLLPLNLGDALWRFGAVSLVASYGVATTAQLLFIAILAGVCGDRKVLITVGLVGVLLAVALVGALGTYGLDAVQARARTSASTQQRLELTAALVILKLIMLIIANGLLARSALREARRVKPSARVDTLVPRRA